MNIKQLCIALKKHYRIYNSYSNDSILDELIATILSQHTSDINSGRAYKNLKSRFRSWRTLSKALVRQIEKAIRCSGLAKQKAKRIKEILVEIEKRTGRCSLNFLKKMSTTSAYNHLINFKGVGPKTAACVLLFAMKRHIVPVDTHVHRLCIRLGLIRKSFPIEKAGDLLTKLVPKGYAYVFHVGLIAHGRAICKARTPNCKMCFIKSCLSQKRRYVKILEVDKLDKKRQN